MESAAQSIVSQFGQLLVDEVREISGVGDKVVHLMDELATMNSVLRMLSEADQSSVNHLVREWVKQVRELAYDAEDCADIYWLRITINRPIPLLSCIVKWPKYQLEKLLLQRTLAAEVKALLDRTTAVSERRARYGIDHAALPRSACFTPVSAASAVSASAHALRRADDPDQFVGIWEQANALAERIKVVNEDDKERGKKLRQGGTSRGQGPPQYQAFARNIYDISRKFLITSLLGSPQHQTLQNPASATVNEDDKERGKKLKVFSIVGFGGLGKTTLAVELCRQLDAEFPHQALVSVSQAFDGGKDVRGLLLRLLQQILKEKADDKQTNKGNDLKIDQMDVDDLANTLKKSLMEKRYLIVIDDVWSVPAWEAIRIRLPENNCGSRIIVTTRIETVAKAASVLEDFVHHMKPLEHEASEKLFVKRVFASTEKGTCPMELKGAMDKILKKCGGMPLSIVSIASLLAGYNSAESVEMWTRVFNSIGSQMESHPTLEGMRQVIALSYDYLPHHLKSCMMYLSIFPEDYVIAKDRLLYRWIAEGLVAEKRGLTRLEVAEDYYNELISRNMILPDKSMIFRGKMEGCRVHDMMLEVMVSKSLEANFVSLVGPQYRGMPYGKVRRLSIHGDDERKVEGRRSRHGIEAMKLQHVRSLTTFKSEGLNKLLSQLGEFKLLRVLDLEDCEALQNKHMRDVCRLYLLRFLGLRSTNVSVMPREVGDLEHLETLDVQATGINLPPTVTKLNKLERLKFVRWILPRGIGNMKALREMDGSGEFLSSNVQVAREIGELQQLQVLILIIRLPPDEKHDEEEFMRAVASSLSKTYSLRSLRLVVSWGGDRALDCLLHISSPPPLLRCLNISGRISQLPDWISSLTHLTEFTVYNAELAGDQLFDVLCKLPNLQSLTSGPESCKDRELVARTTHSFPELRILEFSSYDSLDDCLLNESTISDYPEVLRFEEGTMTKLEKLLFWFSNENSSIVGIENLKNLKEVKLYGSKNNPALQLALEQLKAENEGRPESNQIKVVTYMY